MKVPIFGGFPVENPTKKANHLKALLRVIFLSEYGSERFRVRLRRLSEYGSVAHLVERPKRETRAEQYSDTVLDSIAVEDAVENRGLYRILVSRLFSRGLRHYSTTIARLSPPSGLERDG